LSSGNQRGVPANRLSKKINCRGLLPFTSFQYLTVSFAELIYDLLSIGGKLRSAVVTGRARTLVCATTRPLPLESSAGQTVDEKLDREGST
jgi:hypothetical protein